MLSIQGTGGKREGWMGTGRKSRETERERERKGGKNKKNHIAAKSDLVSLNVACVKL